MRSARQDWPVTRRGAVLCLFVAFAMIFGGSGSPSARPEALVQIVFAFAFVGWFVWADPAGDDVPIARSLWLIAGILIAFPVMQLVPLPPQIWHALPGRELQAEVLATVGAADAWRPLSVAPHATVASLLAIVPAVGAMLAAARIERTDHLALAATIGVVALIGAALGVLQMAGGPDQFRLYEQANRGWLVAFHANRNAAADVLLIGMMALAAWTAQYSCNRAPTASRMGLHLLASLSLLLALVMTGSRTGIALGVVAIAFHLIIIQRVGLSPSRNRLALYLGGALAILASGFALVAHNAQIGRVAERFDADRDFRSELWTDGWTAAMAYFPFGSGVGTFTQAFLPFERLSVVDPLFPNRAHNDFLELLIEGGVIGIAALIAVAWLLFRSWRLAAPSERASPAVKLFAIGTLTVIALHSIVDYPLRNMALAVLAGVAAGLLGSNGQAQAQRDRTGARE